MQILNRQATFNYEILDKVEAGIVLQGCEVKSIRAGQVSLKESFAKIRNGEAWLFNAHIAPYSQGTPEAYEPTQTRKLLLNKKEIDRLVGKLQEQGLSLVPLRMYTKGSRIKLELGLGKGKKKHDKRAAIREKELKRIERRILKNG